MAAPWPLWRRILFRFFFIFLTITMAPWAWFGGLPGVNLIAGWWYTGYDALSLWFNDWLFHVPRPAIPVQNNGSGDTSASWAGLYTTITLAVAGAAIWSLIQRQRKEYTVLNYWLCLFTRYFIILISFSYGVIKLYGLQMHFPSYSQLATPLGDFLPMRFSWMFIGYSAPYQFFSGLMEVLAGSLLLFRRTATLGAMVAAGVFLNVAVLNLSYDIPVKIFSIEMTVCCLFLLANEANRILCFFVYNRPAAACALYQFPLTKRWMRISRIVLKIAFVILAVGILLYETIERKNTTAAMMNNMPFAAGVYDVRTYAVNGDTLLPLVTDTLRWQNMIFDNNSAGSIATSDTAFRERYKRAYFSYKADTVACNLDLFKKSGDSVAITRLHYQQPDPQTIVFRGRRQADSLYVVLKRSTRHFQLAERQFHWISEANR